MEPRGAEGHNRATDDPDHGPPGTAAAPSSPPAVLSPGWWFATLTDHVLPGLIYLLATIGNVMLVAEIAAGRGIAAGLDPTAQTGLLAQRIIFTVFVGLIALLFMIRRRRLGQEGLLVALLGLAVRPRDARRRREVGQRLVPALVAIAGTNAMALMSFFPVTETSPLLSIPGAILGALGLLLAVVSLATLGRCFGIFPEVRGLVTQGPYAIVRHPLYLAEIVAAGGGLLPILAPSSIGVFALFVGLQYRRAMYEERVLAQMFPEYRDYARRTWRIVPGIH